MTTRKWTVHVYFNPTVHDGYEAATAQEAQDLIMRQEYSDAWNDVMAVGVLRRCECGNEMERTATECGLCFAKLD